MVFYYHNLMSTMFDGGPRLNNYESRYRTTLSKTNLRSDRGDLRLYSFAGSNLHGGGKSFDWTDTLKGKSSKSKIASNLYANLKEREYTSKGFYDHLRATTPPPRKRPARSTPLLDDTSYEFTRPSRHMTDADFKTMLTGISDYDSDLKKNTKKITTTTESWVPLTTYIYNTPYHSYYYKATPFSSYTYRTADDLYSYNYVDDYNRYTKTTTKTTSKNVDALDLSMSSKYSSYTEKCSKIQSQLDEVNRWMSEAESKIKNEVVTSRNKIQTDLAEVAAIVEDTAKYNDELHNAIRRQAKQISTLSSQYSDINRNISDVLETLDKTKARCQTLQSDLSSMQSSVTNTQVVTTTKRVY